MPRYYLTRIELEGFRGVNNEGSPLVIRFRPDCVNSIFAANGTGKSSVFEALHYAIRGTVPSLSALQQQEEPSRYINNLFHKGRTATISLELTPDDASGTPIEVTVRRDPSGRRSVSSDHPDAESILTGLDSDFALLDHNTFARFIQCTPLERGRSFAPLLGLSEYSNLRRALQSAADTRAFENEFGIPTLENSIAEAQLREKTALGSLASLYPDITGDLFPEGLTLTDYASRIVASLAEIELVADLVQGRLLSAVDFGALRARILEAEKGQLRTDLERHASRRASLLAAPLDESAVSSNLEELKAAAAEYQDHLAATRGTLVRTLSETALELLESGTWPDGALCPLCGSRLERDLAEHVEATLALYQAATTAYGKVQGLLQDGAAMMSMACLERLGLLEAGEAPIAESTLLRARQGDFSTTDLSAIEDRVDLLIERRAQGLAAATAALEQIQKSLPPSLVSVTSRITDAQQALEALTRAWQARQDQSRFRAKIALYRRWKSFIDRAASLVAEAESQLSKDVLASLETDYRQMFTDVVSLPDVVPSLSRADSGQHLAVQLSEFHGLSDVSARALLSESFRNALAISVFLSAAVRYSRIARFVVLDDATSSFDSGNQFQLMEYIRSRLQQPLRADGLQFILLSHDVTLEKYFDKNQSESDWHHQRLHGWPPTSSVSATHQAADRLRSEAESFIRSGRSDIASGLVRQYFEFVLLQVITKVGIPVPIDLSIKDHARMVDACLRAILEAVDLHDAAGRLALDPGQRAALCSRHVPALVGNWVSHYSTGGAGAVAPNALLGVLDDVDGLRRCFQYEDPNMGLLPVAAGP